MKLNGALKPRQGASTQGSSPGVVVKGYRVKRYFKVNKNVVNGLPPNECGVKNTNLTKSIINSNNTCINNQQQRPTTTPLTQQLERTCKHGDKFSSDVSSRSSSNSLTRSKFSASIKTKEQIYLTPNTTQNRFSAAPATKTKAFYFNLSSCQDRNRIEQTRVQAAAETLVEEANEANNEKETGIVIDSKQRAVINITTRQTKKKKTELKEESKVNKSNNNNGDEKETKQVKPSKYHVTVNKNQNIESCTTTTTPKEVNQFLFNRKINVNTNLTVSISWLFVQLLFMIYSMFTHATKHSDRNLFTHSRISSGCSRVCGLICYKAAKMIRIAELLRVPFHGIKSNNARGFNSSIVMCMVVYAATAILLPQPVVGDDGDTFFPINGLETTTPEFDYASRGQKKFGDKCENTLECGFPGSICDPKKKSCQCTEDLPVTNHIDKCGKEAAVNESCFFNEQCEVKYFQTECRDQRCVCRFDMTPVWLKDGSVECKGRGDKKGPETYVDPAMIGVLIGMALMFIIICVVLRLFSQARWRENRTIFNTPNPRLMNVSLLRESKLLHGQERRGSRMSVRAPSRQPSMASLRPHSPNPSLGKTGSRSNSHGSNASATSLRSTRSNSVSPAGIVVTNNAHHERKGSTYQPHQHHHSQQQQQQKLQQEQEHTAQTNIISNPVAETVTVEIIEPEK